VTRIAIFGDVHDQWEDLHAAATIMANQFGCTYGIQVGDLGLNYEFDSALRFPFPIYAIDGNHEDHELLHDLHKSDHAKDPWAATGIRWMRRGEVITIGNARVGFLGGALHGHAQQVTVPEIPANKPLSLRRNPRMVWAQYPLLDEVETLITNAGSQRLDLLVTHSCPSGAGIGMRSSNWRWNASAIEHILDRGLETGPTDDLGEPALTVLRQRLSSTRSPHFHVFGHWHRVVRQYDPSSRTDYLCVGICDATIHSTFTPHYYDDELDDIVVGEPISLSEIQKLHP